MKKAMLTSERYVWIHILATFIYIISFCEDSMENVFKFSILLYKKLGFGTPECQSSVKIETFYQKLQDLFC